MGRQENRARSASGDSARTATQRILSILTELPDEVVVLFVCAYPEPDDEITVTTCQRAVMVADSD
jgi:hypothetical protein